MKKITGLPIHTSILILIALSMGLNLIPSQPLKAAPGMDRKIILAMEKIKQELRQEEHPADPVQGDIKNEFSSVARDGAIPSSLAGEVSPKEDEHAKPVPLKKAEPPTILPPAEDEPVDISLKEQLEKRGSLKFVNEDIRVVLRSLAKAYNFNITLAPEVQGKVTVDFTNVKIINALDTILVDQGLSYQVSGNILRVTTMEKIQEENAAGAALEAAAAQKAIEEAKKRVAVEAAEPLVVKIFKLKYIDANDAKEAIEPMISARGKVMVLQTKQYTGFEFEATETFGARAEEKAATEFVRSRTLIVQDIQTVLDRVDKVIKKIDQRPPQIMIDAKVLEVPIDREFRLGINWTQALNQWQIGAGGLEAKFGREFKREKENKTVNNIEWSDENKITNIITGEGYQSYDYTNKDISKWGINGNTGPSQSCDLTVTKVHDYFEKQGYDNTDTNTIIDKYVNTISDTLTNLTTSGQAYSAVLGAADFNLMLSAMKTDRNIVILSNPRIIVHENYAAKIFVGERYPILKTEVGSEGGGAVGGTSVDEWKEIGITLKVIPQVRAREEGDGDRINMIIHPAVSTTDENAYSVDNQGNQVYSSYPIIKIREADTNVTINDGDTIVIGGLISSVTVDQEDKIPLLGDIPILGYLFKEEYTKLEKTNLLIFITARIVTEDMELSAYEKIMLEKSPPDALEDVRYVEDDQVRPYLYKSAKEPEPEKPEEEEGEESKVEEKEGNKGEFQGRTITKAMKRSRRR
ncbi:MAG: hypothetical protein RAO92_04155 [Candidatus Euphemobacter frigidus]|nr:hypothetical protein [Candidatus Euphemobacter frigidus]MDP8275578.1 hypothetical protein [Candidatus Euphemobacter frigidus]